jgi:hypothetical protein
LSSSNNWSPTLPNFFLTIGVSIPPIPLNFISKSRISLVLFSSVLNNDHLAFTDLAKNGAPAIAL